MYNPIHSFSKGEFAVYKYAIWARVNQYQTVNTVVWANSDWEAKMIAESQYGQGNVLGYSQIHE